MCTTLSPNPFLEELLEVHLEDSLNPKLYSYHHLG